MVYKRVCHQALNDDYLLGGMMMKGFVKRVLAIVACVSLLVCVPVMVD